MLKKIDELYKYILIMLLVVYLINSIYLEELMLTFTIIALAILLELVKQRHRIKQLTFPQFAIIGVVLLAGGAGTIYLLVLFQIFLEPFRLPSTLKTMLLILFVLVCLYGLGYFLRRTFGRALKNQ
ncbi:hypothetical protein [Psychrobacillus sp. OK032]|uniref:hypothetical protein n=1 Tax=Psychrobacillus sp. OK032 TaxID=1884358 RepID=UPI0008CA0704|nr:hypothetical protein [Psychrobacillus sp. OK032]SES40271.1 hypothetical protein SAMN05518872_11099 [Psychrobacillus sp. OK032]